MSRRPSLIDNLVQFGRDAIRPATFLDARAFSMPALTRFLERNAGLGGRFRIRIRP